MHNKAAHIVLIVIFSVMTRLQRHNNRRSLSRLRYQTHHPGIREPGIGWSAGFWLTAIPPEGIAQHHGQSPIAFRLHRPSQQVEERLLTCTYGPTRENAGTK